MSEPQIGGVTVGPETSIFVAGYVTRGGGDGGFEWDLDRERIEAVRAEWIAADDADVSGVSETRPANLDCDLMLDGDALRESITSAIDAQTDLWEPPAPREQA